jgi:acyl-CoA synthetase (AMP-forming)/AMP-acid ligase II
VLTFIGRLKRFIKLGGEMISLPAIEAVLEAQYSLDTDEGPVLAVAALGEEDRPEIVLFTVKDLDREAVNAAIRQAGLSGLHNVRRVVRLDALPLLGTGKVDYRALASGQ